MYIVLKSCGDIQYASVNFTSTSEMDAKQYAEIMSRNMTDYHFFVVKLMD